MAKREHKSSELSLLICQKFTPASDRAQAKCFYGQNGFKFTEVRLFFSVTVVANQQTTNIAKDNFRRNLLASWSLKELQECRLVEKAMAPHSSTLAWKIPWMEEPGGLQSKELQRVGHN